MKISGIENHPAPTPPGPREYTLFFIPSRMVAKVECFFSGLEEPEDYFVLVSAMRVDQLSWQPDRIKRSDVRTITQSRTGVWVALSDAKRAMSLRSVLQGLET